MSQAEALAVARALNMWSLGVQVVVAAVMVTVFLALWLSSRRESIFTWGLAWLLDLVALVTVLLIAAGGNTSSHAVQVVMYLVYATSKIGFAALLLVGLEQFFRRRRAMGETTRWRVGWLLATLLLAVLIVRPHTVAIQAAVYWIVALLMGYGGVSSLAPSRQRGTRLLPAALLVYSVAFLHHAVVLVPWFRGGPVPRYMSHVSFIDAGVELLLGVILLLALGQSAVDEMARANARLEAAQRSLRELVDADPLTGLYNRRRLRRFITASATGAGVLIYLDVDRFKNVNDRWGHAVGDDCLRRVAEGLRSVFRTEDGLFRMGGDEFLVVAPGLDPDDASRRLARLHELLAASAEGQPPLTVSAGIASFGKDTPVDQALVAADHAMYREKGAHRR
ncbi:MAG: GGDEF domain-containing protein [Acidobacteria bacterium]|nr:GGDEF domain-containing protein [Acidobacteriota bacterium]